MNDIERRTRNEPIQDLREWLEEVEGIGELVRIDAPVNRDEVMSALVYMLAKRRPSPAVLFDNPAGFAESPIGARLLWNLVGPSLRRVALTLEEPADTPAIELIGRVKSKMKNRTPPAEIRSDEAPIFQNTLLGEEIDLDLLPIPRHWPLDGGRYGGTGDAVITRDPDSDHLNIGTYRMMQQGKRQAGLYLSPGKDARLHIARGWARGEEVQVAAAWGIDPLFMLVGSQGFPKNVSEYEYVGGLKGQPVPVVRGKTTDLLLPANADLVLEGVIRPNATAEEGPFGEFTGYYGKPGGQAPLVEVTAVHFRDNPILTNALMADYPSCEQSGFFAVIRSARIWDDFDLLGVPGIKGVYAHPAVSGGLGMTVISLEQLYAGHAAQALALAAQMPGGAYFTKWIIAVDEDIDPSNIDEVLWAMGSRCDPIEDIDFLRNTWSTPLDPSRYPPEDRPYGSKALINVCKPHKHLAEFAKRTTLRREIYDEAAAAWKSLGLPGEAPEIRAFETGR